MEEELQGRRNHVNRTGTGQAGVATGNQKGNAGSVGRKASISLYGSFQSLFRMFQAGNRSPKLLGHEHKVAAVLISQREGKCPKCDHYHLMKEHLQTRKYDIKQE